MITGTHFIIAPPGNGKGVYGMKLLAAELAYSKRQVVISETSVKLDKLQAWLEENAPKMVGSVYDRITILEPEEVYHFWRYRGLLGKDGTRVVYKPELKKVVADGQEWERYEWPKPHPDDCGVYYWIPEVHQYFGKDDYAKFAREGEAYFTQLRKLGDTVVFDTQAFEQVAKPLRIKAQDFTYCRNLAKEKRGLFRLPSVFSRSTYLRPWNGNANEKPMETKTYTLDATGLSACYDTAAGVGIHGRGADIKERRDGLRWQHGVVAVVAIICLVPFASKGMTLAFKKLFNPKAPPAVASTTSPATPQQSQVRPGVPSVPGVPIPAGFTVVQAPGRTSRKLLWWQRVGDEYTFGLDDGRAVTVKNPQFTGTELILGGQLYIFDAESARNRTSAFWKERG